MERVCIKWLDERRGKVKGGRYDGYLVKISVKVTGIPFAVMMFTNSWELIDYGADEKDLKKKFENWLNN